jgi:hypothetical protein
LSELAPFTVEWATKPAAGAAWHRGWRRFYAKDDRDARVQSPKHIARDLQLPEASIEVVQVTKQEPRR